MLPRVVRTGFIFSVLLGLASMVNGCIGSDKPRRVKASQFLEKPYIPPIDPRILIPAQILRDDISYQQNRRRINEAAALPYKNIWKAHDDDIKRVNNPKKAISGSFDAGDE